MANIIKKDLYDKNAAMYILSCLMRKPLLLQDDRYAFVKTDFDVPVHQMVFYAIFNMAQNGAMNITPVDVDLSIKQYDSQYQYYQSAKGYDFVLECYNMTEGADGSQFETYYNKLKKFSVLRDLEGIGIDTTEFYNPDDTFNIDIQEKKLNDIKLQTISDRIRQKLADIESRHIGKDEGMSQLANEGLRKLFEGYLENPEVGLPMAGDLINFAARGLRKGKMYLYSAPSGVGKSRFLVSNACAISMPYLNERGEIVYRGTKEEPDYQRVLLIGTEMRADEYQTMILASVSGVNEKKILLGNSTPEERERIEKALDIIDKYGSNLIIEYIPDPNIALLKSRIVKYIIQEEIEYVFYDYIFNSPGLVNEFSSANLREDVVLMMMSNSLKEIASSYSIFMMSCTQLNESWSKQKIGIRDQNCIRGSKAVADKADLGIVAVRMDPEEYKQIEAIWQELKRLHKEWAWIEKPNMVLDLYKNRRGELVCVKIFRHFDLGTCRTIDLFVTDGSYKLIESVGTLQYEINKYDFLDLKTRGEF